MSTCANLTVEWNRYQTRLWSAAPGSSRSYDNATVTCFAADGKILTCVNGSWTWTGRDSGEDSSSLSDREKLIVGIGGAALAVVFIALVIVTALYCRIRIRNRQKREERLAATLERLSIRDPLDELVRRESGRSSLGNPAYLPSPDDPEGKRKLFKVWDYTRTRKQFVFAEGLEELVQKGGDKLNLTGPIRVVLEEDGTEIDNDAVLRACAGMVFLLLEQNQVWSKPELVLSVHEYSNNLNHYHYDMDEKL